MRLRGSGRPREQERPDFFFAKDKRGLLGVFLLLPNCLATVFCRHITLDFQLFTGMQYSPSPTTNSGIVFIYFSCGIM